VSLARQLYKLQQIDLELQGKQQALNVIETELHGSEALLVAESELTLQEQRLAEAKKEQRNAEWELKDLQDKGEQVRRKLYSGMVKNPKELVSLEQEEKSLKTVIRQKEDELLELMSQVEEMQAEVKTNAEELERLKQEWQQKGKILSIEKNETEIDLARLQQRRQELAQQITPEVLSLYEQIKVIREQPVAKVEQGRCQGCHITLPTSQWQKAKIGNLIQCNSCNRILYME